jgi:hypothetical protein
MSAERNLFIMRNLYMGLMAETMARYAKARALEEIEQEKRSKSLAMGETNAEVLGVTTVTEAFTGPASVVECASWGITETDDRVKAVCKSCKLMGMCKKLNTPSPCRMYCLNPIEGMVKTLNRDADFKVESTLWDGNSCVVKVS